MHNSGGFARFCGCFGLFCGVSRHHSKGPILFIFGAITVRSRNAPKTVSGPAQSLTLRRSSVLTNLHDHPATQEILALDGIKPKIGFFETEDGAQLRFAKFPSAFSSPHFIVLQPGKSGTVRTLQRLGNGLARAGFNTFALEPFGQGGSPRGTEDWQKTHVDGDFGIHRRHTAAFIGHIRKQHGANEIAANDNGVSIAAGHSLMGASLIPTLHRLGVDGFMALAPMIEAVKLPWGGLRGHAYRQAASFLSECGYGHSYPFAFVKGRKSFPPSDFADNKYTNDRGEYARMEQIRKEDAELGTHGPTVDWINAVYKDIPVLQAIPPESLTVPTVLVLAEDDHIIRNGRAMQFFTEKYAPEFLQIETIEGAKHQLDHGGREVVDRIIELAVQLADRIMASRPQGARRSAWAPQAAAAD
jgi:alpha-beta hydrolase superfamily lysophospholipase